MKTNSTKTKMIEGIIRGSMGMSESESDTLMTDLRQLATLVADGVLDAEEGLRLVDEMATAVSKRAKDGGYITQNTVGTLLADSVMLHASLYYTTRTGEEAHKKELDGIRGLAASLNLESFCDIALVCGLNDALEHYHGENYHEGGDDSVTKLMESIPQGQQWTKEYTRFVTRHVIEEIGDALGEMLVAQHDAKKALTMRVKHVLDFDTLSKEGRLRLEKQGITLNK